ncbi:sulfur carrier protein ThiS [Cognatishimia activa]|uniref:Sulfur carrier protein ThiS n=1 Tax=Cognatishimia activa TaxID=1715691 RepID=A0A0P1J2Y5_9RHOB|nr:sulfur carrier protein ThiS [Cognatishimia activa]MEE2945308.1 sulfur carrier protein ThiS [Pseudomonadota bacterium]CUI49022.1 sulfur carrier protein ThiS [Cognatishimia activa]CUK27398.1 sulfur carrier protein ThiS [Cognatishimia activa]
MKIVVNGEKVEVTATQLDAILIELGHGEAKVATALNEEFVPATMRADTALEAGDRLEIVAPRQGG